MFALASGLRAVQQVQLGGPSPLACAVGELRRLASSHPAHRGLAIVFGCFALTMVISKASLVYVSSACTAEQRTAPPPSLPASIFVQSLCRSL